MEIKNALIESVTIDDGDRGLLTAWLRLDFGNFNQSFGGYALYLPKSFAHHNVESVAGHFICRCMEIGGVNSWSDLTGKTIRVKINDNTRILAIGHIVKDDWFNPDKEFETARNKSN